MVVLDASALLAVLKREVGWERVPPLENCVITAVNAAEVVTDLARSGWTAAEAVRLAGMSCPVVSVDDDVGLQAGLLHSKTRALELSLADCICIAYSQRQGLPTVTSDKKWSRMDFGVEVIQFR